MYCIGNEAIVSNQSKFNLSAKCLRLCTGAKNVLSSICAKTRSGEISLMELSMIKEKSDYMSKLLSEALSEEDSVIVMQLLEIRLNEKNKFMERLCHLGQLCLNIKIHVNGKNY